VDGKNQKLVIETTPFSVKEVNPFDSRRRRDLIYQALVYLQS
jgi:hypothetical protein